MHTSVPKADARDPRPDEASIGRWGR